MWRALGNALAGAVLGPAQLVAALLSPLRIGRLLQTVSLPRLREHRLRSTLTALGIALGVAVVISVALVSRSIDRGVTQTVDDLAGKAELQVSAGASGVPEALLDTVRAVPGVAKLTPVAQQIVPLRTARGERERLLLLGVDLLGSDDSYFRSYGSSELDAIRRDSLSFLNSTTNIILSQTLAERLGLRVHDHVSIATSSGWQSFEIWGFIRDSSLSRAFGGALGVMYYPALQVAFERGRNIDRIDVAVESGTDPEQVARALERELGAGYTVERPASRGERVSKLLVTMRTGLTMACLIAVLAGVFLVFNTISISIVQRRRELGILRALGVTRGELARLLTLEGVLLGTVGSALGLVLGLGLSRGMLQATSRAVDTVYLQQSVREVQLDPLLVAVGCTLGCLGSTLAAWLAARRTLGLRPSEVLSAGAQRIAAGPGGGAGARDALGLALLALAAWLASLPPVGRLPLGPLAASIAIPLAGRALMPRIVLASHGLLSLFRRRLGAITTLAGDNVMRDLNRSASTASGLMAGGALMVSTATFIVSFMSSLNTWSAQTVPGDLFVTSGAATGGLSSRNTPMADSLRSELPALPGVERVRRTRLVTSEFRGSRIMTVWTDVNEFVKRSHFFPIEGSAEQLRVGVLHGAVLVSENFSRLFDVHRGARIALATQHGSREFDVAGVILDYTNDQGTVLMDRATYVAAYGDTRVDTYELHLAAGVSPEAVREQINQRFGTERDLFVLTNREFRGEFERAVDSMFNLMNVLELVTLIVAVLGMITATLANVLDRVREIGVLRAIGTLRAQVRRLIVLESTFVGAVGAFAGIAVGVALGYVLLRRIATVQIGWYLPYRVPLRALGEFLLIALPASALAGFYPAREAARLSVRDALDYE